MKDHELKEKLIETPAGPHWERIGVRNHHGICLPLFSLLSERSCGIGEFLDLIPIIEWCNEIGMDVIQLLPLNDIGLGTSPYNALSANALNPIHISLSALPEIERVPEYQEKLAKIRYWNRTSRIKYHIVRELKFAFFREYISRVYEDFAHTPDYRSFLEQNKWIEPYALFKSLKEEQLWKNWEDWPNNLKSPSERGYQELLEEHNAACQFHSLLQYLSYKQLEEVKKIATQKGVLIKGDIPILISRDSADVWRIRHYFLLHQAAGAPPDMYSRDGQYWGFPIYDWEELEKHDYDWWRERLQIASHLYHLYRIDHVVGFFRMWAISLGKPAKEGAFIPSNEEEWIPHGRKLMEMMIKTAPILPIGEDLGLVPPEVKHCLYELGICGTKMMRWERRWETDGGFIPIEEYQPMTMSTVSTHDSDTLQLWWRHFPKEAKLFSEFKGWDYKPFLTLDRHKQILWDCHHSSSLFHINLLQEYLALFPELVSKNPNNERINIPGKILDTNWTYRFRPTVEKIIEHIPLRQAMLDILS
ncbi:MAG: 4-alpha-glucanotransferase [Chlamydiales bacterium]|nr:4-alpha-glucanotransferase [Chlamydiales bacterium]